MDIELSLPVVGGAMRWCRYSDSFDYCAIVAKPWVRNCIVFGCSNTQEKGVSLFKFPTESKLRKTWTSQVQRTRDKWKGPSKYSAICCEHFTEDCFELTSVTSRKLGIKMKQRLKSTAVPTIFPRPPSSTTVPKRLCTSSAFEKRERAWVTYSI